VGGCLKLPICQVGAIDSADMAPIVIDVKPLFTEGDVSVWRLRDIPIGVPRGAMVIAISQATGHYHSVFITTVNDHEANGSLVAAVSHEHLISNSTGSHAPVASPTPRKWEIGDRVWWAGSKHPTRGMPYSEDQWVTIIGPCPEWPEHYMVGADINGRQWASQGSPELLMAAPPGYIRRADIEIGAVRPIKQEPFVRANLTKTRPRSPRECMTPEQWGVNRDTYGVCSVCKADDSMWCDRVIHLSHAYGATPIPTVNFPITRHNIPPHQLAAFSLAACTGEMINRRDASPAARAAWSAELRLLVKASEDRERNRVVVDRDFEDWE
jgi:hypothetical protein